MLAGRSRVHHDSKYNFIIRAIVNDKLNIPRKSFKLTQNYSHILKKTTNLNFHKILIKRDFRLSKTKNMVKTFKSSFVDAKYLCPYIVDHIRYFMY